MSTLVKEKVGYVGAAVKRVEDPRLIQGLATYVDDLRLPGVLHAVFVRSPHAHARVGRIDVAAARTMTGVVGVFTGADVNAHCGTIPCAAAGPDTKAPAHTVLAGARVYFVGHPVAVVVGATPYLAADAAEAVEVDYEPLPVVVDPEKALEPGSPLTHPDLGTNVAFTWNLSGGDIDAAFRNADRVVAQRIYHQRLTPMTIEPRGCVAQFDRGTGGLTLWTSTQIPHLLRALLAGLVGVPENRVRVVAPEVGGGFGSKIEVYAEEVLCSHLAMRLSAPVKWIERRRENAAATIHGRDQIGDYEVAITHDGTILGIRSRTIADIGSYLQLLTPAIPTLTGLVLTGCYKIPAMRMDALGVYTHKMATDAYRGAGRPEATYLIERLMDLVAAETNQDPIELRRRHFPKPEEFPFNTSTGLTYDSGNYDGALRKAMELARWDELVRRRETRRREGGLFGIGVSTYVEICGIGPRKSMPTGGWEWGSVRLETTGKVTVVTGATPHGQGQETSFAQIVADRLGIPIDAIVVLRGDTSVARYGRDTYGSRATAVGGSAILMCCDRLVDKGARLAAHLLEVKADQVEFAEGTFGLRSSAGRRLDWAALAVEADSANNLVAGLEPGLEASAFFEPDNFTFPFGTHICAVEVDPATGAVTIVRYVAVDDCGRQINPLLVEGQVQGGIAQSIGQALFEQTVYDEHGQLLTGEFTDYAMPRAEDIPEYVIGSTVTPTTVNPLGVKGVGEAGTIGATPAVANAVMDALRPLGVKHLDLPLTPEKVWRAITGT